MLRLEMIGNLGADAQIIDNNGHKFCSFRVAHTDKWKNPTTGQETTQTTWVSCTINGDGGKLLPYLKKGVKVFIRGSQSINMYNSAKTHQLEASLNCAVWEIELCGSASDNKQQQTETNPQPSQTQQTATQQKVATNKKQQGK